MDCGSIIPDGQYRQLVRACARAIAKQGAVNVPTSIVSKFRGFDLDTIIAVFRQQYQRHLRRTTSQHRRAEAAKGYVARFKRGENISAIAKRACYSSYMLSRIVLEKMLSIPRQQVSRYIKNPDRIPDARLREQVLGCIARDTNSSPFVDRIRQSVGEEFELLLQRQLFNRGIPFEAEDELRKRGFSKTPDVKLLVPIGVVGRDARAHVVNWIDSKAMFGDNHTHYKHNEPQLRRYVNRFGPGMVIYWGGVVETIGEAVARAPDDDDTRLAHPGFNTHRAVPQRLHHPSNAHNATTGPSSRWKDGAAPGGGVAVGSSRVVGALAPASRHAAAPVAAEDSLPHHRQPRSRGRGRVPNAARGRSQPNACSGMSRRRGASHPFASSGTQQQVWSTEVGTTTADDVVIAAWFPSEFVFPGQDVPVCDPMFKLGDDMLSVTL